MNSFLSKFRSQVFEGAIDLFKKVFVQHLFLYLIITIISLLIVMPLMIYGLGWTLTDLINIEQTSQTIIEGINKGADPEELILGLFSNVNYGILFLAGIISLFINSFSYIVFLKINQNKVFDTNFTLVDHIKSTSFSAILKMIGFYFLLMLLISASFLLFFVIIFRIALLSKVLAILLGFFGFFFVCIFLCRFTLALPALIHGNLSITNAFGYSFVNLTWKRAGLLFLMSIALFIAFGVISAILSLITLPLKSDAGEISYIYFALQQVTSFIAGIVMLSFSFSALSALYYRYSADENQEEDNIEKHLIDPLE
ncbi:MAG: hypothetical protein Q8K70_05685 [Bacteroidota bacterium]|nr:hypothetical protein [Bacteroidota bacterium]